MRILLLLSQYLQKHQDLHNHAHPGGNPNSPLQALIFDSQYDSYRGVVVLIRVVEGSINKGDKIRFMGEGLSSEVEEVGILGPDMIKKEVLTAGEVGYIITGIKEVDNIVVGDTVTSKKNPAAVSLSGYRKPKPMVYSGLFPLKGGDYENFTKTVYIPFSLCFSR